MVLFFKKLPGSFPDRFLNEIVSLLVHSFTSIDVVPVPKEMAVKVLQKTYTQTGFLNSLRQNNIKNDMTKKEKAEKAAWYIGSISSYGARESNWKNIFLKGEGGCVASRYALAYMCQHME